MKQPVIKWSGSKRYISNEIIKKFPKNGDVYYEPFIGGGSVLFELLKNSEEFKFKRYIASDINKDLITLWEDIINRPDYLKENYLKFWKELNKNEDIDRKKEYFYQIRREFNQTRDTSKFLFLSRTCLNGLIRYNKKNEFNTSLHFTRPGINPNKLNDILNYWNNILIKHNVEFKCRDYSIINTNKEDVVYLDPPYAGTKRMYYGKIDYTKFFEWVQNQEAFITLSFDGITDNGRKLYSIPSKLFTEHRFCSKTTSSFSNLNKENVKVFESLYIKNKDI